MMSISVEENDDSGNVNDFVKEDELPVLPVLPFPN